MFSVNTPTKNFRGGPIYLYYYYDSSEDDTPLSALKEGEGDFGLPMHNKGVSSVEGKEGWTERR